MSATVDIRTDTKYDILTVPIQAVTTRKDSIAVEGSDVEPTNELKEVVFLYRADTVYQVGVKTGIQDNSFIEILSGISAQDEVVIAPYTAISKRLKDMDLVEKVEEKDLFEEK
jgi:HlyD family secretion protein